MKFIENEKCIKCDKPKKALGLCWMHYQRFRRTGTVEKVIRERNMICKNCGNKFEGRVCRPCYLQKQKDYYYRKKNEKNQE